MVLCGFVVAAFALVVAVEVCGFPPGRGTGNVAGVRRSFASYVWVCSAAYMCAEAWLVLDCCWQYCWQKRRDCSLRQGHFSRHVHPRVRLSEA
jgi:hypothetical protein